MNKILCILFLFAGFIGCTKDGDKDRDTLPPVITINGVSPDYVFLNNLYPDPGATAMDNMDGSVAVTSNYSTTNPNLDSAGTYQIKYTAKDNSGNMGYAYRSVIVENSASAFSGNYIVTSITPTDTTVYNQVITIDPNLNSRIHFSDLGNFSNNSHVYANIDSPDVVMPLQYSINIGVDNGQPCDVVNHSFESIIGAVTSNGFILEYDDIITAPLMCQSTKHVTAYFVKQ